MIFVTTGAQMPFDRLIRAVDEWAARRRRADVFAQVGHGLYEPRFSKWVRFMGPADFKQRVQQADLIVAHAGMGSILTALEYEKPIVIMPRRGALSETRNDHQVDTARRFESCDGVMVAYDETELGRRLDDAGHVRPATRIGHEAAPELIESLRRFIEVRST